MSLSRVGTRSAWISRQEVRERYSRDSRGLIVMQKDGDSPSMVPLKYIPRNLRPSKRRTVGRRLGGGGLEGRRPKLQLDPQLLIKGHEGQ